MIDNLRATPQSHNIWLHGVKLKSTRFALFSHGAHANGQHIHRERVHVLFFRRVSHLPCRRCKLRPTPWQRNTALAKRERVSLRRKSARTHTACSRLLNGMTVRRLLALAAEKNICVGITFQGLALALISIYCVLVEKSIKIAFKIAMNSRVLKFKFLVLPNLVIFGRVELD